MAQLSRRDCRSVQSEISGYFSKIGELFSSSKSGEFKDSTASFSRNGPLSADLLVVLFLYLVADAGRSGYKVLLSSFWDECRSHGIELPREEAVSAAAFCKARRKIKPDAFRALLNLAAEKFYAVHGEQFLWKGSRVLACDGTRISTQRGKDLSESLGEPTPGACPQIQVSTLYDVLAGLPLDLTVGPYTSNERADLTSMLGHLKPGDILVLDRGYPSSRLIEELTARGIQFLIPVKSSFKAVMEFVSSKGRDRTVHISPNMRIASGAQSLKLRAVRRPRKNKDGCVVFVTNIEQSRANARELDQLYAMRWKIEELYKIQKGTYLGQGQFHAKNVEGIHQEVYAFALFVAITRGMMAKVERAFGIRFEDISQKAALLALASYVTRIFVDPCDKNSIKNIQHLVDRMSQHLDPPRPGRQYPRRSFKPLSRWTRTGKRKKLKR